MSWVTEYLVISYPIGLWKLHCRSHKLYCTCELKWRSWKYVGCVKMRTSVISAHIKRAGTHPRSSQTNGKIETSSDTWAEAVTRLVLIATHWYSNQEKVLNSIMMVLYVYVYRILYKYVFAWVFFVSKSVYVGQKK